tara:strand:+ start:1706 stop:2707 length:1002 start_codon:yes stop_codon:yes gene_type:complete
MNLINDYIIVVSNLMNKMSPYLLLGFLIAGILSVLVSSERVEKLLGKARGIKSISYAAIIGIPLPLCSCGVLPLSASIRKHGASKAACSSFLLSTPQTGVDSILVTYTLFNPIIAMIRPIIALITGIISGLFVHILCDEKIEEKEICKDSCCSHNKTSTFQKIIKYAFITLPKDIANPLIVGVLLSGIISIIIPDGSFDQYFGGGIVGMIVMLIFGLPLYVCATASIPLALILIGKGASLGAAMVFLMVGPATNTTSVTTMIKILGKKGMIVTLISLSLTSICAGLIIDSFNINPSQFAHIEPHLDHGYGYFNSLCSIILIGILTYTIIKRGK